MAKKPRRCRACHFLPCRCEDLAAGYMGSANLPACWPMQSDALSCHPAQAREHYEDSVRKGVATEFKTAEDGYSARPVFTDAAHKKAYCEAYGYFDRNGGYSSPRPGSRRDVPPPPDPRQWLHDLVSE